MIKVKEVQLRPRTDEHDLEYKFKNIRTFLEDGDKAKITMMFRGREVTYVDQGHKMMKQLAEMVADIAIVEATPKLEGKKLIMILAPNPAAKKASKPQPKPAQQAPAAARRLPKPLKRVGNQAQKTVDGFGVAGLVSATP